MEKIRGNSYYFNARTAIGAYKTDDQLILIDAGNDDSSIKKAIKSFGDIHVSTILNTHSHADHCGGNAYIQKQHNCNIYAPVLESAFIENPVLEPTYLYGAAPLETLKNKFLYVKPSVVTHPILGDEPVIIGDGLVFKPILLAGHSPNQMGYLTDDGIAYLGDALVSEEISEKHPLIFTFDVQEHLNSLERLKSLEAHGYVIAHGGYYENIQALIHSNHEALIQIHHYILEILKHGPCTIDGLHAKLVTLYHLEEQLSQAFLNRSVIMAHLKYLVDQNALVLEFVRGRFILKRIT